MRGAVNLAIVVRLGRSGGDSQMRTLGHLSSLPTIQDTLLEELLPFDIARLIAATSRDISPYP
jgi:hypothetical protein